MRKNQINADDAPIEAWQQAMLPELQQVADSLGLDGPSKEAFVFLCLLRLKAFDEIATFKQWVHEVTGYPLYKINEFVARAKRGFLIVDGRANAEAIESAFGEGDDETYVGLVLMTKMLEGKFCRDVAGNYSLPAEAA